MTISFHALIFGPIPRQSHQIVLEVFQAGLFPGLGYQHEIESFGQSFSGQAKGFAEEAPQTIAQYCWADFARDRETNASMVQIVRAAAHRQSSARTEQRSS